ncbi:hypothetical protein NDU88_005097 [Pleurodeles waltl]|uniref:Uncharacterized protein n=1 Tax=Pleurodeles waltl TaxID=8319 RepID=A0AAV7WCD8_PLEWA|nr:hypothetical protein NDU88_005097 [Pleurodeles waltl]
MGPRTVGFYTRPARAPTWARYELLLPDKQTSWCLWVPLRHSGPEKAAWAKAFTPVLARALSKGSVKVSYPRQAWRLLTTLQHIKPGKRAQGQGFHLSVNQSFS